MQKLLARLLDAQSLTRAQAREAMGFVMDGEATSVQTAAMLAALKVRGETFDELVGFAQAMRERVVRVQVRRSPLVDTCGTGGDGSGSLNISTAAALVAAGAGAAVAKHGNRSVSSRSGSADVLEALGVKVDASPAVSARCLDELGMGFFFAPACHPAVRYATPVRRELGVRTVFNRLGPLANPAGAKRQVMGVWSPDYPPVIARVLRELGCEEAMVVCSRDGMDEISLSARTLVAHLKGGRVRLRELSPADFGLPPRPEGAVAGGAPAANAAAILGVLKGNQGAARDVTLANASAALLVAGLARNLKEGTARAAQAVDSGRAMQVLEDLKRLSHEPA